MTSTLKPLLTGFQLIEFIEGAPAQSRNSMTNNLAKAACTSADLSFANAGQLGEHGEKIDASEASKSQSTQIAGTPAQLLIFHQDDCKTDLGADAHDIPANDDDVSPKFEIKYCDNSPNSVSSLHFNP